MHRLPRLMRRYRRHLTSAAAQPLPRRASPSSPPLPHSTTTRSPLPSSTSSAPSSAADSVAILPPPVDLFEDDVLNEIYAPPIPSQRPPSRNQTPDRMRDAHLYGPELDDAYERQLKLEEETLNTAVERFRKMNDEASSRGDVVAHRAAHHLLLAWYNPFIIAMRSAVQNPSAFSSVASNDSVGAADGSKHTTEAEKRKERDQPQRAGKERKRTSGRRSIEDEVTHLMTVLPPDSVAIIVIHTLLSQLMREPSGVPLTRAAMVVAEAVRAEVNLRRIVSLHRKLEENAQLPQSSDSLLQKGDKSDDAVKARKTKTSPKDLLERAKRSSSSLASAVNFAAARIGDEETQWTPREQVLLGTRLIDIFMSIALVKDASHNFVPAIMHAIRFRKSSMSKVGTLQFTDTAFDLLKEETPSLAEYVHPKQQPMVVPPRPWTAPDDGAYLRCGSYLVRRTPGSYREVDKLLQAADLSELYEGLNALGEQTWRVNCGVLDVAKVLWDQGGGKCGLVSKANCNVPERKSFLAAEMAAYEKRKMQREMYEPSEEDAFDDGSSGSDEEEFDEKKALRKLRSERRRAFKMNRELVSLRAEMDHRMRQALRFEGEEKIWLPHNVDFRGRAYPMAVHLQHMGCDLTRALLTFGKPGVMLGERGLYWLKVHLANLLGGDKLSFTERVDLAEDNIERAIRVGRDPLKDSHLEWLGEVEDPFQLLAACCEFAEAAGRFGGTTGMEMFESSLPVSMDGSCNGLQHYAALGRDVEGGIQVNVVPSERPQDVYTGIANLVAEKVAKLAAEGDEFGLLMDGKVSRKLVKQTVMTSVYGVTTIGARQQIFNRLSEMELVPEDKMFFTAFQLARLTLSSLGDIFEGATETMGWLYDSARRISKHGHKVQWTTPVGLPVMQPYKRSERNVVRTLMQRVTLNRSGEHTPVSTERQRSAFPPNFVHSIDSAHMLLTAIGCRRKGLNFAAVHDSFWTNAAHVDDMHKILREEFIQLHERDLLMELLESFRMRYDGVQFAKLPPRGGLDLSVVRESKYFFS